MALSYSAGDVLEHCQLNNMIRAANGDGVLSDPDSTSLEVTALSTSMMVRVLAGKCRIGDEIESKSGTTDLTIEASHATLYRKDLITYDASANTPAGIKGTDHAGGISDPIYPPDIPAGDILLAIVEVNPTVTTIIPADLSDARIFCKLQKVFQMYASDVLRDSNDATETIPSGSYAKIKDLGPVPEGIIGGTLRIKFAMWETSGAYTAYVRIYRNGVAVGTTRSTTSSVATTWSEDIDVDERRHDRIVGISHYHRRACQQFSSLLRSTRDPHGSKRGVVIL